MPLPYNWFQTLRNDPTQVRAQMETDAAQVHRNALLKNEVARVPQANRAQDLGIQAAEQEISTRGRQEASTVRNEAAAILGRGFSAIEQSADPLKIADAFFKSQEFQKYGPQLGLPVQNFRVEPTDNPRELQTRARDYARLLGGGNNVKAFASRQLVKGDDGRSYYQTFYQDGTSELTPYQEGLTPVTPIQQVNTGDKVLLEDRLGNRRSIDIDRSTPAVEQGTAESAVKQATELGGKATLAYQNLGRVGQLQQMLERIETGRLEGIKTDLRSWGDAFGIPVDESLGEAQAFTALVSGLAVAARQDMPGQMSNADRDFIVQQAPELIKTKHANRVLLEMIAGAEEAKIAASDWASNYLATHREDLSGFNQELNAYLGSKNFYEAIKIHPAAAAGGMTQDQWMARPREERKAFYAAGRQ